MKRKILIIEDDVAFGTMLKKWFERNDFEAIHCSTVAFAKEELSKGSFTLVLSDLRLPDGDGILLLQWMREACIFTPFIVMTSYGEIQSAVSAMKLGAEDFLEKPINPGILRDKIDQVLAYKTTPKKEPKIEKKVLEGVVFGNSSAAKQMYDQLLKLAPTKMSILILGESGTGKEYAARMIHENSDRRNNPFIAVDCGSLSKELAPSELFGHLKGSFTSAIENKKGVFEQANGGTVFLDEVGNLSYEVQVQLLRVLQEQRVRPVGGVKDIPIDIRILSATNEDLEKAISEGFFREDLYHRLNEFSLFIPALRERIADIHLFAEEFLLQANKELNRDIQGFSIEAMKVLEKQYWSGNLRELRNVVRRTVLFASTDEIHVQDLPIFHESKTEDMALRPENEKAQIEKALYKARGNKTLAAQLLKIDRKTLYNKIRLHDIK